MSLLAFNAYAKFSNPCFSLLTTPPMPSSQDLSDEQSAWIASWRALVSAEKLATSDLSTRWKQWHQITPSDRQLHLALELRKLYPAPQSQNIVLSAYSELTQLSHENLSRLTLRLQEIYPLKRISPEISQLINQTAEHLRLAFLRPTRPAGGPEVSIRELQRVGIDLIDDSLIPSFATIPWEVQVTDARHPLANITKGESISLDPSVAQQSGFILPDFKDALDLFMFFDRWDPQVSEEVFQRNQGRLPFASYAELRHELSYSNPLVYFPHSQAREQLAPFFSRLRHYMLTTNDAREFFLRSFRHWAFYLYEIQPQETKLLLTEALAEPIKGRSLIIGRLLPFLNMAGGLTLHLPLGAAPSEYETVPRATIP